MTSTRSLPAQPADAATRKPKRFGLSWVQIIAAGFASITATVILSFFSISGTLIGAAVFSMASAVGNAVYGSSLRKTQDVVLDVVPFGKADPASPTVVLPVTEDEATQIAGALEEATPSLPAAVPAAARTPGALSRRTWKRVAIFAVSIFAVVMAIVTGVELIAGRPLTDLLRGEQGSGTSLTGGGGPAAPTVTVVVTPSVVYTTPTVTQTAPPTTATTTPTTTPTTNETPTTSTPTSPTTQSPTTDESTGPGTATSGTPTSTRTAPR